MVVNTFESNDNSSTLFDTCDADLIDSLGPEIIKELSDQCQEALQDPELRELFQQESSLFKEFSSKLKQYEELLDPNCDPNNEDILCPTMDFDLRNDLYNSTDLFLCHNVTSYQEFLGCMIVSRTEMIQNLDGLLMP